MTQHRVEAPWGEGNLLETKHDYRIRLLLVAESTAIKKNLKHTISISISIKSLLDIEDPGLNLSTNNSLSLPAIRPPRILAVRLEKLRQYDKRASETGKPIVVR
jgi:hypothetical protein